MALQLMLFTSLTISTRSQSSFCTWGNFSLLGPFGYEIQCALGSGTYAIGILQICGVSAKISLI